MLMLLVVPRGRTTGLADIELVETGAACWLVFGFGVGASTGSGALMLGAVIAGEDSRTPEVLGFVGTLGCVGCGVRIGCEG